MAGSKRRAFPTHPGGAGMPCPLLIEGTRISNPSVPPWAPGVLRLQLHNFTPASILHIAGYAAFCELFLGCEAHFELWKRLFCLVPHTQEGSIYQVGGDEIWRIAGTGYLSGTPKKTSEDWPSEWFYMEDVPLLDPIWMGLPEFSNGPLKKRHS